jgi:hypothetical protein
VPAADGVLDAAGAEVPDAAGVALLLAAALVAVAVALPIAIPAIDSPPAGQVKPVVSAPVFMKICPPDLSEQY